jgi:hypothetical protein
MTLNWNNPLVRFYLWGNDARYATKAPGYINLCDLFWVVLFKAIFCAVMMTAAGVTLAYCYVEVLNDWRAVLLPLLVIAGVVTVLGVITIISLGIEAVASTATWQFIKGNYCPRIKLED